MFKHPTPSALEALSPPSTPRVCFGGISAGNPHKFSAAEPGTLHWLCSAPRRGQRQGHDCVLCSVCILGINKTIFLSLTVFYSMILSQSSKFDGFSGKAKSTNPICGFFFNILKTLISCSLFELCVSLEESRKLSWIRCFVLTALLPSSFQSCCAAGCSILHPASLLKGSNADNIFVSPLCQLNLVTSDPEQVSAV